MTATLHLPGYHSVELIYSGTKTLVYKGIRDDGDSQVQPVIIKILRDAFSSLSQQVQFRNQHTIACQLTSAHIVKPLALKRYDNGYALILPDQGEIVLSEYWSQAHSEHRVLLRSFLAIAIQLAEALHDLGKQRVIHKDIKPSNILIHPDTQKIQLIDFSLSSLLPKEQQQLANLNVLEGTLAYLSPEQTGRMNRSLDYRTDFYSLGVSFYELLTGQLPFLERDPMALLHCHLAKMPVPPHEINAEIPGVLSEIVLKLMAKNAEDRYQSALGLKHDLVRCLEQLEANSNDTILSFDLGEQDRCDRFLIPEKLYGRQQEVDKLLQTFERVAAGAAELVMVTGFSGIGKTAVVNEVHKPITQRQGYFIQGKFDQLNRNRPFSAFLQAFNNLIEQLLSESDEKLIEWRTRILEAVGNNGQILINVIPNLQRIIGPQPPAIQLSGSAAQNRFNLLLGQFIRIFATTDHPLVIFLDDLQWVDSASLGLLKLLLETAGSKYLMLIGAYRNNEVSPSHPLMLALADSPSKGSAIATLTLAPLDESHITQLVADTLLCPVDIAIPLAQKVYQKTNGNPFFATQFLQGLHQEGWITFDADAGYWECNLAAVQQLALTDDVVDFMIARLQKLPTATRSALTQAACIGNQFDLATLAVVCEKSQADIATDLWQGLQEGFIIPDSEIYKFFQGPSEAGQRVEEGLVGYRFLHDRVQQAAYALIPKDQTQATHWHIGQRLLATHQSVIQASNQSKKIPTDGQTDRILFEIVNQLNAGANFATTPQQKQQLIQLNLLAGHQAKAATAYPSALAYFQEGNRLLPSNSWESDYPLILKLKCETIEVAYLSHALESVKPLMNEVLQEARTFLDKIKVYEIQIQAAIGKNQLIEAVDLGFDVLEQLGVPLLNPDDVTITLPSLEQLDRVPAMSDSSKAAALGILVSMFSAIYNGKPELLKPTIWTMVHLCTTAGHTSVSPVAYSVYGMSMCGSGNIDEGYQSGRIALQLTEQALGQAVRAKVLEQLGGFISHWKEPVKTSIQQFEQGLQSGLDVGDIEYACHAAKNACAHLVLLGTPLDHVQQRQLQYIELGQQLAQQHILIYAKIWRQLTLNLMGQSGAPWLLVGDSFDEESMLPTLKAKNNYFSLYVIYFSKQMLCYLFGEIDQAIENTHKLEDYSKASLGSLMSIVQNFYTSLILLANYHQQAATKPKNSNDNGKDKIHSDVPADWPQQVDINQAKMKQWANHAPMNHLHKYQLVEAEKHAALGRYAEAIDLYDRAIAGAQAHDYIQEEALANELAAKFYLNWGKEKVAAGYIQEAYYCYARWGAKAKTNALERDYPQLLKPILQADTPPLNFIETLTEISHSVLEPQSRVEDPDDYKINHISQPTHPQGLNQALDLATVLNASRAISQTIHLDELLRKLTTIILQSSGGDRCALILPNQDEEWQLQAIATVDTASLCTESLTGNHQLPIKLIQYVKNTQQTVAIDRLATDLPVIDDYLRKHQPQSLLCFPLLSQGNLIGILYLHNLSTSGVFTRDRLSILNFLCTEAATSLEKANLYQALSEYSHSLESKVKERTQDLEQEVCDRKEAQAAAEAANRVKSEFLANMSHELRSPLNAILGFAQVMARSQALPLEHQQDVTIIHRSGEHLLSLINDVLDMSKIEAGRTTLNPINFDLYTLLNDLRDMFQLNATNKSLHFEVSRSPDLPQYIHADLGKIRQVLINLLSNALKFTQVGHILLRASALTQAQTITLQFEIEDSGPGIGAEEIKTIFEPFVQTKIGRAASEGTGLGLSISRKFVQLMGGDITLISPVTENTGTLVSFEIQTVAATELQPPAPQRQVIGLCPGQHTYRLLIVDDQATNRKLLVKLLQPLGFELEEAETGPAAIALCQTWHPHLILMDIRMPDMNGADTTQAIRALPTNITQPKIIALSASTLPQQQAIALKAGCDAFMDKPFQESDLLALINEQVGVQYLYDDSLSSRPSKVTYAGHNATSETSSPIQSTLPLTALHELSLSNLSAELLTALEVATVKFQWTELLQLIEEIRAEEMEVAEALNQALQKFQYMDILQAIKSAQSQQSEPPQPPAANSPQSGEH